MSLFGKILTALGIKTADEKPAAAPKPATGTAAGKAPGAAAAAARDKLDMPGKPPAPTAVPVVDVVAKLEGLAAKNPQKLNWKVSIVDLLKLLDIDSSLEARKDLAKELGCPADLMGDSAKMNVWLHKTVLQKIAANGGNIPRELLD
jgi:hypothetical protein